MEDKYLFYQKALEKKREQKEFHQLRCLLPLEEREASQGEKTLNFSSGDVLGLSQHPFIKKTAIKYVLEWGAGTTPSRLVTGHIECHRQVEEKLATLLGKETVALFPSPYLIHEITLSTITNRRSLLFVDRSCHLGLMKAAKMSQGKVLLYEHNDMQQLKVLLEKNKATPASVKLIISETLFGFDGTECDMKTLDKLASEYQALLYLDDCNAVGILGKCGMGLAAQRQGSDLVVGAFGKASGSFGAYLATPKIIRNYLMAFNPQLQEITLLPPAVLGAIDAVLELIPDMQQERNAVLENSEKLRLHLQEEGWNVSSTPSQFLLLQNFSEEEFVKCSRFLARENISVTLFPYGALHHGEGKIRIAITALHTEKELSFLLNALKKLRKELLEETSKVH